MFSMRVVPIVLALALAGCEEPTPQTTGVVQETNVPCTSDECRCDLEHAYTREVTRGCSGFLARVSVCSTDPVCDAVIDGIVAQVASCTEPASPFDVDLSACP